ncbi:MAG: hypothetical protein HC877_24250 [Thioploca sp.]|nr:hypothetical protein [Thioploca sp.]
MFIQNNNNYSFLNKDCVISGNIVENIINLFCLDIISNGNAINVYRQERHYNWRDSLSDFENKGYKKLYSYNIIDNNIYLSDILYIKYEKDHKALITNDGSALIIYSDKELTKEEINY